MFIDTHARETPDKLAAVLPASGDSRTYRELNDRSCRLAQLFYAQGLRPGDHIAIYLENNLAFFDAVYAGFRSGLYVTPINRYLTATEAGYIVDNCDAKALIASAALAPSAALGELATRCTVKLSVGGAIPGFEPLEDAIAAHPAAPLADERIGSFMFYSSGTTGKPKGILRTLTNKPAKDGNPAAAATMAMFGIDRDSVYLSPAPLYHGSPAGYTASVLQVGGTVVVMDKFEPELALELIERYRVTHSQWVPTMFIRLLKLDATQRAARDLSSHRYAIHAAAPCPVDVKRQMIDWWGPIIVEFYTSTEATGVARISSQEWLAHPGSVGRSVGLPFHVCDDEGNELPPGQAGLIYGEAPPGGRVRYHKDEDKTLGAEHPLHPTWMTVGDIGYLDAEGFLYLTDRKAFMIISGGVNIYPQQIEDALALHPKVADVAVIGVPNADLGEEVKAVVQPAAGVVPDEALAQEIKDYVQARLGRQLTPRTVDFTEELPRLPTGKLYKKALRDRYWPQPANHAP